MCKIPCLQIPLYCQNCIVHSYDYTTFINETVFTLSASFIAGFIFYYLTVYYPESKREKPIKEIMICQLKSAKEGYAEAINSIYERSYDGNIDYFINKLASFENEQYTITPDNSYYILHNINLVASLLQYSLSKIEYYDFGDINRLNELMALIATLSVRIEDAVVEYIKGDSGQLVKKTYSRQMCFGEKEIKSFAVDLIKCYDLISKIYENTNKTNVKRNNKFNFCKLAKQ